MVNPVSSTVIPVTLGVSSENRGAPGSREEGQAAKTIQRAYRGYAVRNQEALRADCGICLESDRRVNLREICPAKNGQGGHTFHLQCAKDYFATVRNPVCPNCRADLLSVDAAQPALVNLGTRYSNYVEPTMTAAQAYELLQDRMNHMPANPTDQQRSEISELYNTWTLLRQNENSIA